MFRWTLGQEILELVSTQLSPQASGHEWTIVDSFLLECSIQIEWMTFFPGLTREGRQIEAVIL